MIKVAVTELEYGKAPHIFENAAGFKCFCAPTPEAELAAFVKTNHISYVIVGIDKYLGPLYDALPRNGVIARFGVGHDGIDKTRAAAGGIYCTNTPGALDNSVAECAMGLLLTAARHLAACAADNKNSRWKNRVGTELAGKTLAVIGCGNIGRKVARIAKSGFGMNVIGSDIITPANNGFFDAFTCDFTEAVKNADFVSLHIPETTTTRDFINSKRLAAMKNTTCLINTARGGILDENALYDAVTNGAIGGAALDVFKTEPYFPQSPDKDLRSLEKVIMTPHLGSSTLEACERMARAALNNIKLCAEGKIGNMNIV